MSQASHNSVITEIMAYAEQTYENATPLGESREINPEHTLETEVIANDGMDVVIALKERRKNAGMTQVQLAEVMGVTQSAIANLESNRRDPRISTVAKYARAVGAQLVIRVASSDS